MPWKENALRCTGILIVLALAIGCTPGGGALRQSMPPLRQTGSELIHRSGLRAGDQSIRQPSPVVTPDPPAGARESPPEFSYDLYSDEQGHFSYDGAALALVERPSHLQRVYADAARGEARPRRLIQELEYWFQQTGLAVADRTADLGCQVLPELQSNCRPPNWGFIEQFLGNSPEGVRLREVLAEAYARRAHQLGVRNDVTIAGVNLLLVGSLANAVLARVGVVEARTAFQKSLVPETKAAEVGASRLVGANRAIIDPRKLTEYALNPDHPVGGNKARVFERLGFNRSNADELMQQLRTGVMENTPIPGKVDQFGARFTVDIPVVGPQGSGVVRTGWILKPGSNTPELTTLFVR